MLETLDEMGIVPHAITGCSIGAIIGALYAAGLSGRDIRAQIEQFFAQAAEGTLPRVCWVEPEYGRNDDHPPEHPLGGQVFVQSIYQALVTSPHRSP